MIRRPSLLGAGASRPFAIDVVWRSRYQEGERVAARLAQHFTHRDYQDIVGGVGLPVVFRETPDVPGGSLFGVNRRGARAAATVLLLDSGFPGDAGATAELERLDREVAESGPHSLLLPVVMEDGGLPRGFPLQALRWDRWEGDEAAREEHLVRDLNHTFCQLLLRRLHHIEGGASPAPGRVRVFLSHSKHDRDGAHIAVGLRDWMDQNTALGTFFDLRDIPPGTAFTATLREEIEVSAFVAVRSDSYSARGACRSEVLEAKRRGRPFLVLDCLREGEDRAFPYLGNVRTIRVDPASLTGTDFARITGVLLREVFLRLLWRCRVADIRPGENDTLFLAGHPEALSLASLPDQNDAPRLVHPDPSLPAEEAEVLRAIVPGLQLLTFAEWQEQGRP